jgi:ribonuclease HI
MPWLRARLRDQIVFARATPDGQLLAIEGSVEIRYKPNDGRLYKARAQNLTVADPRVLPDETCGDAQAVVKPPPGAAAGPATSEGVTAALDSATSRGPVRRSSTAAPPAPVVARRPDPSAAVFPADVVIAYTDGACSGNPGPAGMGMVLIDNGARLEISEYLGTGTNNIAELTAVLRALENVADPDRPMVVHTDSKYSIGVLTQNWKAKANKELIAQIRAELARHRNVRFVYVPGHAGVPLNERADELAREGISTRGVRRREYPAKVVKVGGASE